MSTNLETELIEAAQAIRQALSDLGLCYITRDGSRVEISYKSLELVGDQYGLLEVDTRRLPPRVRIDQLVHKEVLHHLTAVIGRPVKRLNTTGLTYCVVLQDMPRPRLPRQVDLPLNERPAGPYVIGFGQSREGPLWRELSGLTHLIVAGSSDSGKSAFLRCLVYQLLRQPAPLDLYLADMEGLTFAWVEGLPALRQPIAQDVKSATDLTWLLLEEIERRARLYAATGRFPESLAEYHTALTLLPRLPVSLNEPPLTWEDTQESPSFAVEGETGAISISSALPHLAWIAAVFDEFTALAEAAGKRSALMDNIAQLAQRSRKFGLTLILAGQDFKADLLNTRITNQVRTRVQFRCASRQQSEVVLGQRGAEQLSAPGRALIRLEERVLEVQTYWLDKRHILEYTAATPSPARRQSSNAALLSAGQPSPASSDQPDLRLAHSTPSPTVPGQVEPQPAEPQTACAISNQATLDQSESALQPGYSPNAPLPTPGPMLSDEERALADYAIEHLDGEFVINRLFEAFRGQVTQRRIVRLAQAWEHAGLLTPPPHKSAARRVTPRLREML